MAHQRLSTVFDYSDLRLHPDGLRVHQSATKNLRPGLLKTNVKTSRENWVARDAGGLGIVPKFRPRRKKTRTNEGDKEEEEEGGDDEENDENCAGTDRKGKGKAVDDASVDEDSSNELGASGKRKRRKSTNKYKLKRLKFAADLDYLAPSISRASSSTPAVVPIAGPSRGFDGSASVGSPLQGAVAAGMRAARTLLPEPSADLLKAIHRYASEFYTERGQLLNISREYRATRKQRAALRKEKRLQKEKREAAKALEGVGRRQLRSGSRSDSRSRTHTRSRSASAAVSVSSGESDADEDMDGSSCGTENGTEEGGEDEDADTNMKAKNTEEDVVQSEVDNDHGPTSHFKSKSPTKGKQKATNTETSKAKEKESKPKRTKQPGDGKVYTDMYKVFDGSAMLALGMLVQEHIAHLLTPRVPPGWEDEMREWYTQNEENEDVFDTSLEGEGADGEDDSADENMEKNHGSDEDILDQEGRTQDVDDLEVALGEGANEEDNLAHGSMEEDYKDNDDLVDQEDGTQDVDDLEGSEHEDASDQIEVAPTTKKTVGTRIKAKPSWKAKTKKWTRKGKGRMK